MAAGSLASSRIPFITAADCISRPPEYQHHIYCFHDNISKLLTRRSKMIGVRPCVCVVVRVATWTYAPYILQVKETRQSWVARQS